MKFIDTGDPILDYRLQFSKAGFQMFGVISSPQCQLKELHLQFLSNWESSNNLGFEEDLINMLKENQSLEVLHLESIAAGVQFPAMNILEASVELLSGNQDVFAK